jgi:hypothetical protein
MHEDTEVAKGSTDISHIIDVKLRRTSQQVRAIKHAWYDE